MFTRSKSRRVPQAEELKVAQVKGPKRGCKRKVDTLEAHLDACLEDEKAQRKKRWMDLFHALEAKGFIVKPKHIGPSDEDRTLFFRAKGVDFVELAHEGLYLMSQDSAGDFFDAEQIACVVTSESSADSEPVSGEEEEADD